MAVFEVVYLVAAVLWIFVVVAALYIGGRSLLKFRARRRRMNRLIDGVRLPLQLGLAAVSTAGKTAAVLQRLSSEFGPDLRIALPWTSRRR